MHGFGNKNRNAVLALGAVCFFLVFAAQAKALSRPALSAPANGTTVAALPAFSWAPVAGAAKYQIQIASDANFASLAEDGTFFTRNTRATLRRALPDGQLWWRVRASDASGTASSWSTPRSISKGWDARPTALYPANAVTLEYPEDPFRLMWSPVDRAYKYSVIVSEHTSLASPLSGFPRLTSATSTTFQSPDLEAGQTYYWEVTPQDARGNLGTPSVKSSFVWAWPTTMSPSLVDLASAGELFDPRFFWDLVPGASEYQVQVNSDEDFDTGSVVLDTETIGSSFTPRGLLPNNTYYWRVRAKDADGNAGVWNEGASFVKTFDDEIELGAPSITNLRMANSDENGGTPGFQTTVPVVRWNPVPGASSYDVAVAPYVGSSCNFNDTHYAHSATTAWTPLGPSPDGAPIPAPLSIGGVTSDGGQAIAAGGKYCVRVWARDRSHTSTSGIDLVIGSFTDLDTGAGYAFEWTGYPTGGACSPSCDPGYLGEDDYATPLRGSTVGEMPLFTWNPMAGAASYYVIVAREPSFTNIVDYAFTRVPAYAPRKSASSVSSGTAPTRTYSDETTSYYWVVLPSPNADGDAAANVPSKGEPADFLKQTTPPDLLAPVDTTVATQPAFRWTPVLGARVYEIQVDDEPTFADPIDEKVTNSTGYTSESTYEADQVLYWRVRPYDDNNTKLTWSEAESFHRRLARPAWDSGLPSSGSLVPTLTWASITGAVSYDVEADKPDGTHQTFTNLRSAALTYSTFYGIGVFGQRIRANFPAANGSVTHGPWSTTHDFTRTIPAPANPIASVSKTGLSFAWSPRAEAREYRIEVSKTSDFERPVETITTDNTTYAPTMSTYGYLAGGRFYWRVAAVDEGRNVGQFSPAKRITLRKGMRLSAFGAPQRGERVDIKFMARLYSSTDPVRSVAVKIWGAGVRKATKRTKSDGSATFRVRARRMGTVYALATKPGFQPIQIELKVR